MASDWDEKKEPDVHVIMRLRNKAPLLLEKNFGRGKVLALLTTTSTKWNNWAGEGPGPSFVAFVRNLVPYLSRSGGDEALQVGDPKTLTFASSQYQPTVRFEGPGGDLTSATVEAAAEGKDALKATFSKTALSGFYTAKLITRKNKTENRAFAVNVDPDEGDLAALSQADVSKRLDPLKYQFDYASSFETKLDETQGRNLGDLLLIVLVIVLALEQLVAWSCGYHISAPCASFPLPLGEGQGVRAVAARTCPGTPRPSPKPSPRGRGKRRKEGWHERFPVAAGRRRGDDQVRAWPNSIRL